MRLVRSDEEVAGGAVVSLPTLFELARLWYGDRLSRSWRARSLEESQRVLDSVGLVGEFWRLG
ncbi:MAG TPA: hypothetical protein VFG79_19510 [Solirubrobacter sp.]|jgi:hypothetical protein|nr:hypothetical protein [Solirubrobacter sp.]